MNIGYIGFGQMGSAIAEGLARHSELPLTQYAYAPHGIARRMEGRDFAVHECLSAQEVVDSSELVILACKPYQAEDVLRALDCKGRALVSIVNKWGFADFKSRLGDSARVQCIMPNTPVKVGRGTILLAEENDLRPGERETLKKLLASVATLVELPEEKIPAAGAISGCGPAFLYMVIEALGDAGVKNGLSRRAAYELAAGTLIGAGEMVLADPAAHPGALKDAVCSPGGTTIRGVAALEDAGMRSAFIHAVDATLS